MKPNTNYRPDSIYNTLRTKLYDNGLFENQADAVLENLMKSEAQEPMKGRWNDSVEGYPKVLLVMGWIAAQDEAVKWIDANLPQHWARPMFTREPDEAPAKPSGGGSAPKGSLLAPAL